MPLMSIFNPPDEQTARRIADLAGRVDAFDSASIAAVEARYGQTVVAVVYADDGTVYDHCFNWESGQNYALSNGLRVVAVADDGNMTVAAAQALYNAEKERYDDCFGSC